MKKIMAVLLLAIIGFLVIGCSGRMDTAQPPLPKVTAGNRTIPVVQGSYCWGKLGCADYASVPNLLKGKSVTTASPDETIQIKFDYNPQPDKLYVDQMENDRPIHISMKDGTFHAPKDKGLYKYAIMAQWTKGGDTSSVFAIEVK